MADRPIIFSAPMVRALLNGRKTQTRRVLRLDDGLINRAYTGDRLWVREAWCTSPAHDDIKPSEMGGDESIGYAADTSWESWGWGNLGCVEGRARPSIHMPRWASRLTLTVTGVRVQRLQEISEADAIAEGVVHDQDRSRGNVIGWRDYLDRGGKCGTARGSFQSLWNSIHGPAAWDANPWVVALTFDVRRENIDQMEPR